MSTNSKGLSDAQLDAALDRLAAPPPSDTLVRRVRTMAPVAPRTPWSTRYAAAAALVLVVGAAALLHLVAGPLPAAVHIASDPADEIMAPDIALVDSPAAAPAQQEPFSVAGMPLE